MPLPSRLPLLLLTALLAPGAIVAATYPLGPYALEVDGGGAGFRVRHGSRTLLATAPGPWLVEKRFSVYGASLFGGFRFPRRDRGAYDFDRPLGAEAQGDRVRLTLGASDHPDARATLEFQVTARGSLRIDLERSGNEGRGAVLRFARPPEARFLGLGEQFDRVDHTGHRVPLFVSEQGIGRRGKPGVREALAGDHAVADAPEGFRGWFRRIGDRAPWVGREYDTYYPVPSFVDPVRGLALLLHADQRAIFDLGADDPAVFSIEAWEPRRLGLELFPGPSPLEAVGQLSGALGRPRMPPPWAFGTWLAVEGGEARVREAVATADAHGVALDAVWSQDWVGRRNRPVIQNLRYHWEVDRETYPDLEGLIAELGARDVRFLGYINCFLDPLFPSFREASRRGALVGRPHRPRKPFVQWHSTFAVSMIDFTDPAAKAWFQDFLHRMLDLGMDGWMADYGEWLPWAGRLENGTGAEVHNRYPELYHQAVREVLDARRPDGDYAVFTRSGWAGAQGHQQIVWAGDQEAHWDDRDGLATVPRAGISAGLSGIPYWTHDVGGYSGGPRTKELFMRWAELGAFSPVFRTHEGLLKTRNWQWDSDEETARHFARLTRIHARIRDRVLLRLAQRAADSGYPLVRHLALHHPGDPVALGVEDQFLLGPDLLVAPVLEEGATTRRVYLPAGRWYGLWDGERHQGPGWIDQEAPLGHPPVFASAPPTRLLGEDWYELAR